MRHLRALLLYAGLGLPAVGAAAQPARAGGSDSMVIAVVEPSAWVTGGDLTILGTGAVLAAIAQRADVTVRREMQRDGWQRPAVFRAFEQGGDTWGGAGALVTGLALWGGGALRGDRDLAAIGLRATEAITVSGLITKTLKVAIGRARPRVDSADAWNVAWMRRAGNDYESMPSGHTTAAFAFAAAVTSEVARRSPRRAPLVAAASFSLAGVTAWSRLHADAHWTSDVIMGAAIGMASGWAVTRWHATRPGNAVDRLLLPRNASRARLTPHVSPGAFGETRIGATLAWR